MEKIISENTILKVYLADPDISTADLVHLKEYLDKMLKVVELSLYGCGYDAKNAQITRNEAGIRIHIGQVGVIYIV